MDLAIRHYNIFAINFILQENNRFFFCCFHQKTIIKLISFEQKKSIVCAQVATGKVKNFCNLRFFLMANSGRELFEIAALLSALENVKRNVT